MIKFFGRNLSTGLTRNQKTGEKKMRKLALYFGLLGSVTSLTAGASESPFNINCQLSTRVVAGSFFAEVNPGKQSLKYEFDKYHASIPSQNYQLKGGNLQGSGYSARTKGTVSVSENAAGDIKIKATGMFFDRATPIGTNEYVIVLTKTPHDILGGYSFQYFAINGVVHKLEGPNNCKVYAAAANN